MSFVGISSQIKLLFRPPVILLVWHILKQLFTSVSVKMVDIYQAGEVNIHHYSPPLRWIINNYLTRLSKISWFVSGEQINYCYQIIDLRDTDKSRYFAITVFNNCFIIRSPSLFSYFNHFLTAQGSDLPFFSWESCSNYAWAEYYLQRNTFRRYYAWADHYSYQLFAGHVVDFRPMERKKKTHRMIIVNYVYVYFIVNMCEKEVAAVTYYFYCNSYYCCCWCHLVD